MLLSSGLSRPLHVVVAWSVRVAGEKKKKKRRRRGERRRRRRMGDVFGSKGLIILGYWVGLLG
jgi:CelD/BcsL family acetyltransferase involved in cellulose biosynthesis